LPAALTGSVYAEPALDGTAPAAPTYDSVSARAALVRVAARRQVECLGRHARRGRQLRRLELGPARPPGDEPAVGDGRLNLGAVVEDQRHRAHASTCAAV